MLRSTLVSTSRGRVAVALLVGFGIAPVATACGAQEQRPRTTPQEEARRPDVHFVPTPMPVVDAMLATARVGANDVVYDLGSGDGRIVITAAKRHGARGIGIDIDPQRIEESRRNADTAGVADRVEFRQADLFQTDLREATVVTLYLLQTLNERLRPKLLDELRPGTRVVSHAFDMGDWTTDTTFRVNGNAVHFWIVPANVEGRWMATVGSGSAERQVDVRLHQAYQRVTSDAPAASGMASVTDVRIRGDSVWMTVPASSGGGTLRLAGRVDGDTMSGTIVGTRQPWRARRTGSR